MGNVRRKNLYNLLVRNKVADSYQYYRNCNELIIQLKYHYEVLNKVVSRWENISNKIYSKVQPDWDSKKLAEYYINENKKHCKMSINGERVDVQYEVQGRFMLILGMMQSLMDSYAKWINTSLLAGKKTYNRNCNISALCNKINEMGESLDFCREFLKTNVLKVEESEAYLYVNSLNNLIKHQSLIKINLYECVDGEWRVGIPKFKKKAKDKDYVYNGKNMLTMLESSLNYFCKLIDDSADYIARFYENNINPFTYSRTHEIGLFIVTKDSNMINKYFFISEREVNKKGKTFLLIEDENLGIHNCFIKEIMVTEDGNPEKIVGKIVAKEENDIRLHLRKATEYQVEILDMKINDFDIRYTPYVWRDDTSISRDELKWTPWMCKHIVFKKM